MCWIGNSKNKLIATEDIICYKIVNIECGKIYSQFMHFNYKFKKKYKCKIEGKFEDDLFIINKGFHSYTQDVLMYNFDTVCKVVKCHIPKGSVYYINNSGEYVSEAIVIDNIVEYACIDLGKTMIQFFSYTKFAEYILNILYKKDILYMKRIGYYKKYYNRFLFTDDSSLSLYIC